MSQADPSPARPSGGPPKKRRRWWIAGLVVLGVCATFAIGYLIGGNSRDDDVTAAKAQASQTDGKPADGQAQDDQALKAISNGFQDLANAIAGEDEQDDQATQTAIDQATNEIERALQEMGDTASENVTGALDDLREKIGDAVQSRTTETTPSDGG